MFPITFYVEHFTDPVALKRLGKRAVTIASLADEMGRFAGEVEDLAKVQLGEESALQSLLGPERAPQALRLAEGIRALQTAVAEVSGQKAEDEESQAEVTKPAKPAKLAKKKAK